MKLVVAVIKPFKLDDVRAALTANDVRGMTVSEVRGYDLPRSKAGALVGEAHDPAVMPRLKIEIVVEDDQVEAVIDAIQASANTGAVGDGKIFVAEIGQAVRIRTGETDEAAL